MAHNKVTIDVEARFIDHLTGDVKKADKAIDNLDKKKPKVVVDADTKAAEEKVDKTKKKLDEIGKEKPKPVIDAEDKASKKILNIMDKARHLAARVYTATVNLKDNDALAHIAKIEQKARSIAGKTWTAAITIKDRAMAPLQKIKSQIFSVKTLAAGVIGGMAANKYVKQPTQMYADKEDLVTQFAVMLKGNSDGPNYDAAEQRIQELTSFAGETPFTRDEIYQASRVLQTYTQGALATPDATGGLRMIGDIAAATGQEYTRVANYMGRLYNEVGRGGEALGEPLMMLREIGALYAEQEEKIKSIATGAGTIDEKWEKIAGQFKNTDGMMKEMSNQMNNLMLGVQSFFKNNLYMKLGEGISESLKPFLIDFRKWRGDNADLIASWAEQVKDFAADASEKVLGVVRRTASRANKIMQSDEFQEADLFGKIGMLWEGAIKNPFAEWWSNTVAPWWDNTAVPWMTEKAASLGTTIGTGLSNGLLALLGADVPGIADQGASVAGSFVQGFLDGFDGGAIANAFIDAIGRVWDAMPAWAKMLVGGLGISKGAGMLMNFGAGVGKVGEMAKGARGWIGSAGTSMVAGSGLMGHLANAGYALTGGAAGSSLSGLAAAGIGAGAAAGGIAGGVSAISGGIDLYRGFTDKSMSDEVSTAHKASGGMKLGGVAAGAGIGALIGGPLGALLGAGVGGIAGWIGGNIVKKRAAENAASLKELTEQTEDNSKASEVLAKKQEAMADALGDVKLSYAEIQDVASNLLTGDMADSMQEYTSATVSANKALQTFEGTTEDLKKLNWKASVGFKFDEEGQAEYTKAVEDYITSAEAVVENKHYEFTAAVSMLIDPKGKNGKSIIESGDEFYTGLQEAIDSTEKELKLEVKAALKDGVIDINEQQAIEDLQNQISEITNKVAQAENEAKMEALKIKFSAGAIDSESFAQLQEELAAQIESSTLTYDEALTASITSLKLQYPDGGEAYDKAVKELTEGYEANVGEISASATNLQLEILGDSFNIDPEQLNAGLQASIDAGIAPMNWTAEQANKFLNTEGLTGSMATGIGTALQSVAEMDKSIDMSNIKPAGLDKVTKTVNTQTTSAVKAGVPSSVDAGSVSVSVKPTVSLIGDMASQIKAKAEAAAAQAKANMAADGKGFRGGIFYPKSRNVARYGAGGQVAGGAQLAVLAEEGTPEMVIPLGSQRRKRGLDLWRQAGHMMGVPGFANGGIVGGSEDQGIRHHQSEKSAAGSQGVQVNVGGVTVEVNVNGGDNPNIAQAIAAQGGEIAEQIAGILADAFNAQFQNTPTKGVA